MASRKTHIVFGIVLIIIGLGSGSLVILNKAKYGIGNAISYIMHNPQEWLRGDAKYFTITMIILLVLGIAEIIKGRKPQ